MNFEIRAACIADIPEMHRLRTSVTENRLSDSQRISEAHYRPFVDAGSAWIAQGDDGIVGFAVVDTPKATVWALFVDPMATGQGIGLALQHHMIAWSRTEGLSRLSLSTEKRTRAATFYARAGWTDVGTTSHGEVLFEMML